jgi:hypothetical protein
MMKRVVGLLAALAMSAGLLVGMASQASVEVQAAGTPLAVVKPAAKAGAALAKSNVVTIKVPVKYTKDDAYADSSSKTYSVKMAGKTRKVRVVSKVLDSWSEFGSARKTLYIGSKKVLSTEGMITYWLDEFRLVKVSATETLIDLATEDEDYGKSSRALYRFNGKKLVRVWKGSKGSGDHWLMAGSGKLVLNDYQKTTGDTIPLLYTYSGGKLKRATTAGNVLSVAVGQSRKVKINGKTTIVNLAADGACTSYLGSVCVNYPVALKIGSKKVIQTTAGSEGSGFTIRLVKVGTNQTLVEYAPGAAGKNYLYRFNGTKLVAVSSLGAKKAHLAGGNYLVLKWLVPGDDGGSYQYGLYSYASGKLKKLA